MAQKSEASVAGSSSTTQEGVAGSGTRQRSNYAPSLSRACYIALRSTGVGKNQSWLVNVGNSWNSEEANAMVKPVADIVVQDAGGQYFVDEMRRRFDWLARSGSKPLDWKPLITRAMEAGDLDAVRLFLSAGMNPDIPDSERQKPSHYCAILARADFAALIFPCRPSMSSACSSGLTPRMAASQNWVFPTDEKYPQRKAVRRDVESYIKQGGFDKRFPTLPELAVREMWFAVKNLIRRQVVQESEFTEKVEGLTAREWAISYQQFGVAKELHHYARALSTRYEEAGKQVITIAEQLSDKEKETQQLRRELKQLKDESTRKDAKIEQLSKAVSMLRSKQQKAGVGGGVKKAAVLRSQKDVSKSRVFSRSHPMNELFK